MSRGTHGARADLRELLKLIGELRFTRERADAREGSVWTVKVHPWPGERPDEFAAMVSFWSCSRDPREAAGLRLFAHQEGNPRNWFIAHRMNSTGQVWFDRLLGLGRFRIRYPRAEEGVGSDPEAGRQVTDASGGRSEGGGVSTEARDRAWGLIARGGRANFPVGLMGELGHGKSALLLEYARPAHVLPPTPWEDDSDVSEGIRPRGRAIRTRGSVGARRTSTRGGPLLGGRAEERARSGSPAEVVIFHLPDTRVTASLREGERGLALLSIWTDSTEADLRGAVVQFTIGGEGGEAVLESASRPGSPVEKSHRLSQPFGVLRDCLPEFTIRYPGETSSGR